MLTNNSSDQVQPSAPFAVGYTKANNPINKQFEKNGKTNKTNLRKAHSRPTARVWHSTVNKSKDVLDSSIIVDTAQLSQLAEGNSYPIQNNSIGPLPIGSQSNSFISTTPTQHVTCGPTPLPLSMTLLAQPTPLSNVDGLEDPYVKSGLHDPDPPNKRNLDRIHTETDVHILLECDMARQIWSLSDLPWDIVARWHDSAETWLSHVKRTGNRVAHTLARSAVSSHEGSVDPSTSIIQFLVSDSDMVF
ncbi:hypothetical protein BUALT_Bualt03G0006900 [Buddleja alternifolia]|uniref:RNase H type-1 domain-containing protein n=1 Tax=Buddleja alternifolia TaxID=168488 RepID=A0AAV6XQ42_9LAMI|nr:hypothetical protein BUALT_Bualt03G0006900 [Buddleja alternifolia]